MISRRGFLGTAAVLAGASAVSGRVQAASIPEAPSTKTNTMQPPLFPTSGPQ
jgi:manganese oxidase